MGNSNTYITKDKHGKLIVVCLETGEILNSNMELSTSYRFDYNVAQLICQEIREGKTLKSLGANPKFPPLSVIHHWQRNNPSFAAEVKLARQDRADYYHDRVLDIADSVDETTTRDEVGALKFKTDQYKWAAEKGNPASYGNKTELSGTIENKVSMIVLNTGIRRDKPDVEVEYERREDSDTQEQQASLDQPERAEALGRIMLGGSDDKSEEKEIQEEEF